VSQIRDIYVPRGVELKLLQNTPLVVEEASVLNKFFYKVELSIAKFFFFLYNKFLLEVTVKRILIPILMLAVLGACSAKKRDIRTEFAFANKLAKQGLWKEAHYRWKRVLAEGKESASVYNNIAIALEKMGKFGEAKASYQKALKLAPNNSTVKGNYEKLQKYLKNEDDEDDEDKKRDKNERKRKKRKK
jgi:tetratricopeptide (TPR) repeat protein